MFRWIWPGLGFVVVGAILYCLPNRARSDTDSRGIPSEQPDGRADVSALPGQVPIEPRQGEFGDAFERTGFLEEVRRSRHDLE